MTKENIDVIPEFTTNKNGVRIKKCCASCALHETYDHEGPRRKCNLKGKVVDKSDCCGEWAISDFINNIKTKR